ncbi:MAG: D-alanyl-D-alanine carboxypeptidase family protein, partial [Cyanothece sp. SIO2G6]|nr:D-alanyl-D-alanine carboxypeptidase family protein [Cyanothece sp. SIO2G6]
GCIAANDPSSTDGSSQGTEDETGETGEPIDATASNPDSLTDELLGHRRYDQAPEETLVPVVGDGSIRLRDTAAKSFTEMVNAARAQGIVLQPLSGFRSEEEQTYLFFEIKKSRRQSSQERATVSAPPGYSEHHTGYAIDIGDPNQPSTHLEQSFEETAAFKWLDENAAAYGFELSFEGGDDSTVVYEPWHWRYIGDRHSLETFYGTVRSSDSPLSETENGDGALSETEPETTDADADANAEVVNPQ